MNYIDQVEKSIIYIEDNLNENIKVEEIAGAIGYSYYHFHRIFQALVGESVGNYLRKRRITRAAYDLIYTDKRIIDIAMYYRFESQEAFTRAFKTSYAVSPKVYRQNRLQQFLGEKKELTGIKLRHLHEGITFNPEIKVITRKKIVGIKGDTSIKQVRIPEIWELFLSRVNEIPNKKNNCPYFSICEVNSGFDMNKFSETTEYSELIGVEVENFDNIPKNMVKRIIAEGKYAVFTHKGCTNKLALTYDYIWGTWIPCSSMEVDSRDDFEIHDERFLGADNDETQIDIYIPIK